MCVVCVCVKVVCVLGSSTGKGEISRKAVKYEKVCVFGFECGLVRIGIYNNKSSETPMTCRMKIILPSSS